MRPRRFDVDGERRERALALRVLGIAFLLILCGRLFSLQIVGHESSRELARRNWLKPEYEPGPRGRILDRHGRVLAEMAPAFSVVVDPHHKPFLKHPEELTASLRRLAELLGGEESRYLAQVEKQRRTTYKPIRLERGVGPEVLARVEEHRLELPGVSVEVDPVRYYPGDTLAAHVLGYIGEVGEDELEDLAAQGYRLGSLIGKSGIERQYEDQLRGEDGIRFVEVNALGRRSEAYNREQAIPPRPGRDVVLTLDADVQEEMERALDAARYDGAGTWPEVRGAAVLVDVTSGEVLAMASRPGYDANVFSRSLTPEEWDSLNRPGNPLLNRAVQAAYSPGSVWKPLMLYAALAQGVVRPGQYLSPCGGSYRYGNRRFRCWRPQGHGSLDAIHALAQSCDVYFYQLGPSLGVDGIARVARLFGLDTRSGIDLPQERSDLIPDAAYFDRRYGKQGWSTGATLNLVIGQGEILVSPIQLARMAALIATGGRRVEPHLVRALGPDEREHPAPAPSLAPRVENVPLEAHALEIVRLGMRTAVESGTARAAIVPGVAVAGKTGTAQNPGFDHALFVAYAPAEAPQVAVAVILENRGHGGSVAAPVAQRVLAAYFGVAENSLAVAGPTD